MYDLKELRAKLAKISEDMREITAGAEKREDRKLTKEEYEKWNGLRTQADTLKQEIERKSYENDLEMGKQPSIEKKDDSTTEKKEKKEERGKFNSFGEFLIAVRNASDPTIHRVDPRLTEERATGANINIPSEGGFLAETTQLAELFRIVSEASMVASRCRNIPVGATANGVKMNTIDETSRATGSRWGGVQGYWRSEAGTVTAKQPKFGKWEVNLETLMALLYATEESLQDASQLGSIFMQATSEELAWLADDAIINGDGSGKCLGVLNAPCTVSVSKETGQTAATIVYENIIKMWARLWARSRPNAVWFINQDCEPQLHSMSLVIGAGGVPVYLPANGVSGQPFNTLYGRPVIPIEQCKTVGTVGDIILADMSQYGLITKGGLKNDQSIHVQFLYAETVFRTLWRLNGQPMWKSALTPANGSNTLSPFITLATRS